MWSLPTSLTRLHWNIVANVVGRMWSALATFLFVPLYFRFLGPENYGLVAAYSLLLTVFSFTNFGLRAALSRELARLSPNEQSLPEMRDVVRTLELIFWSLAALLAVGVGVTSDWIASRWLVVDGVHVTEVSTSVMLMGIAMAFQFPYVFYEGGLVGLQRQFLTNGIWISTGVLRGVGSVLVLWLVSPTPHAFFAYQIAINAVQATFTGGFLWRCLAASTHRPRFRIAILARSWRYIAGNTMISVNGVALTQVDKLAVSRLLTLETFGFYSLAGLAAQVPTLIAGPITTAVFPELTRFSESTAEPQLASLYHRACQLVAVASLPIAMTVAAFPYEVIAFWTADSDVALRTAPIVALLVLGGACQALQTIPIHLALSHGWTRLNVVTGFVSTITIVPMIIFLVGRYGAIGAAGSWLLLNVGIILAFPLALHQRYLRGHFTKWLTEDVITPLVAAAVPVIVARVFIHGQSGSVGRALVFLLVWMVSTAMAIALTAGIRSEVLGMIRGRVVSNE